MEQMMKMPARLHKEGQAASRVVGNCLSNRPKSPQVKEGDMVVIRPCAAEDLEEGDLIVIHCSGASQMLVKEYSRMIGNYLYVEQYLPRMEIGMNMGEIRELYKVDAVIRNGKAV